MAKSTVEFDFFGMEKEASSRNLSRRKKFDRRRNIRDIQTAISKINPTILRSVIASGCAIDTRDAITLDTGHTFHSRSAFPLSFPQKIEENMIQTSIIPKPVDSHGGETDSPQTMTIFYNGTVSVFQVPQDRADDILKLAVKGRWSGSSACVKKTSEGPISPSGNTQQQSLVESFEGDLPIARRKSLQRFLEKRRERLVSSSSPYAF